MEQLAIKESPIPGSDEYGLIDWSWSARRIRDFIRAQTRPYPGAFTYIQGKKAIIWDADIIEVEDGAAK